MASAGKMASARQDGFGGAAGDFAAAALHRRRPMFNRRE
jgi:hypothetical protein